ncbi:acetyl-CoA carboxylase biotin carboxyl carrier protein [Acetobacterium wieringae]|uniref:acetyl-CoA carboxylase biotin carboxyl carrier protein n=1 Tax=Acetobacterium wieringae TaxID=52694 RepID=UPI0026EFF1D8|nr:acetyl-CoA carboxylase biotin carboxyl carrier protein [Acetobacterium wieringae]
MELTIETIQALAKIMSAEKLTSLALDQGNLKIEITRENSLTFSEEPTSCEPQIKITAPQLPQDLTVQAETPKVSDSTHWKEIKSPMVGVFYQSSQPDKPPYVTKDQHFADGDTLCIIEAMKLMNEITAETAGTIMEVCVSNGQVVEFGQVLYRIVED